MDKPSLIVIYFVIFIMSEATNARDSDDYAPSGPCHWKALVENLGWILNMLENIIEHTGIKGSVCYLEYTIILY